VVKTGVLLTKKVFRSVKSNLGQFLAIIGIATLAVTLFLGLAANAQKLENDVNLFYEECNMADVWISGSFILNTEEENKEIDDKIIYYNDPDSLTDKRFLASSVVNSTTAYGLIIQNIPSVCKPIILETIVPFEKGEDFLVIDNTWTQDNAAANQIQIGDIVDIEFSLNDIISALMDIDIPGLGMTLREFKERNPEAYEEYVESILTELDNLLVPGAVNFLRSKTIAMDFMVTSTMNHAENIQNSTYSTSNYFLSFNYLMEQLKAKITASFKSSTVSDLINSLIDSVLSYNPEFYNQILVKNSDRVDVDTFVYEVRRNLRGYSVMTKDQYPFNIIIQEDIIQAQKLSYVFPSIFFLVAILVIITTISALIIKERTQIGTMKALGLTNKQILLHYLYLMLGLIGIGFIIGAIVGPFLVPYVMGLKYALIYTLPVTQFVFPWVQTIISAVVLISVTFIVVYVSCHHELKLTPAESMRPSVGKTLVLKERDRSKEGEPGKHFSAKVAFRNIRLHKAKSLMVVLGIAGCTALLVCGFGIDDTVQKGINTDLNLFYNSDLLLTYAAETKSQKESLLQTYGDKIESIDETCSYSCTTISSKTKDTYCHVVKGDHPFYRVEFDKDTIAVSTDIASYCGYHVGDKITWKILDVSYSGVIGCIYETFCRPGIILNADHQEYSSLYSYINYSWINLNDGIDHKTVANDILQKYKGTVTQITTYQESLDFINNLVVSIDSITITVKVFAVLLAVVVLFNLIYLNFKERTREMATMKVLGFSNSEVARSLILETMLLALIGVLVGLAIGFPVEVLVLSINQTSLVTYLYCAQPLTFILSFAISFVTAFVLCLCLSLFIRKIKMVESLKAVE